MAYIKSTKLKQKKLKPIAPKKPKFDKFTATKDSGLVKSKIASIKDTIKGFVKAGKK